VKPQVTVTPVQRPHPARLRVTKAGYRKTSPLRAKVFAPGCPAPDDGQVSGGEAAFDAYLMPGVVGDPLAASSLHARDVELGQHGARHAAHYLSPALVPTCRGAWTRNETRVWFHDAGANCPPGDSVLANVTKGGGWKVSFSPGCRTRPSVQPLRRPRGGFVGRGGGWDRGDEWGTHPVLGLGAIQGGLLRRRRGIWRGRTLPGRITSVTDETRRRRRVRGSADG
jgi:hypothetical protein